MTLDQKKKKEKKKTQQKPSLHAQSAYDEASFSLW